MAEAHYPVQWSGGQAVMALPERIDVSNAGPIREELLAVINCGARALMVDMSATLVRKLLARYGLGAHNRR